MIQPITLDKFLRWTVIALIITAVFFVLKGFLVCYYRSS